VMTIDELADELEARLDVLVDQGRDVPERHHSMLGVLDATWWRLAEPDREALTRLAVFRRGFSRADGEAATGVGVSRLARLVDRALVRPVEGGRFDLHPLVWRYARHRLQEHAEAPTFARDHSRHFLGLLARATDDLGGSQREAAAAKLLLDHGNVREAWYVAVRSGDDEAWGSAALGCGRYLEAIDRYREGVEWLREARERSRLVALDDDVYAALALGEGTLLARLARFDEAAAAIAPAVTARDARVRALAHETLAHGIELWRGSYAAAGRHLREAEALYRDLSDVAGGARCTFVLANIAWVAGDWSEALELLRAAREAFRGLADRQGEVVTTAGMGVVEMDRGNLEAARRLLEHAMERAVDTPLHLRTTVSVNLAHVRLLQGDLDGLEAELARGVEVFEQIGDDPWVAETASYAARAAALSGHASRAGPFLRAGLQAALRSGHVPSIADVLLATGFVIADVAPDDAIALFELVRDHPLVYANTRQESASALALLGRHGPAIDRIGTDALVHPGAYAAIGPSAPRQAMDPLTTIAMTLLHDGLLPSGRVLALAAQTV
jgi:tetratricopeptide (TPR) repeat protein